jgi:hypothetical protein
MGDKLPVEERREFAEAVSGIIKNMDLHISVQLTRAKLCRAYYLQLIKEGFTEQQALELCKYFQV